MPQPTITPEEIQALFHFYARLKIIHEIGGTLSKAASFDEFCHHAVELGCSKLGFDRLGIWFLDQEDPTYMVGSYGIDESGNIRDERHRRVFSVSEPMEDALDGRVLITAEPTSPLFNDKKETVGYGWNARAKLWDGEQTVGWISTDNLFSQRKISNYELELLAIYADSLGHLAAMHRAREALRTERNMLRTIIDTVPDIIFVKDTENRYQLVNRAFWDRTDLNIQGEADVIGKTAYEILPYELAQIYSDSDLGVLQSGQPVTNKEEPGLDNAGARIFLTSKTPLHDSQGHIVAVIGVARDVTDVKAAEAQARDMAVERERSQILQEFITNISHDLRTPLTIMNSNLYLLERTADAQKHQTYLANIKEQSYRLERLVEEILTASALEKIPITSWTSVDVNNVVHLVEERLRPAASRKKLKVNLNLDPSLPEISGNADLLNRLVVNLIQNAIAYTPEGGCITVTTQGQSKQVTMEISDTGIGISQEDLPRIFDHLFRADRARSMDTGGTGVGLAIVRRIMELHGGTVEVKSEQGIGSTFRVTLPVIAETNGF